MMFYRSSRPAYGNDAVGYVEVKREQDADSSRKFVARACVTPEHHVTSKAYTVSATVDEDSNVIAGNECVNYTTSLDGCKHVIALLAWLSPSTGESAPTEVQCFWKKTKLSSVGSSIMIIPVESLVSR
jgi:hypothetical protein